MTGGSGIEPHHANNKNKLNIHVFYMNYAYKAITLQLLMRQYV